MKFTTKIDEILDDESFMKFSREVFDKIEEVRQKKSQIISDKDEWRIVDKEIKKKLKNPDKVKGICTCDDDFLCKHRKRYLRTAVNGGK